MECEGEVCKEDRKIETKQISQHIASTVQGRVYPYGYVLTKHMGFLIISLEFAYRTFQFAS